MKKLTVTALAVLFVTATAISASALESELGGYWRTRAWTSRNFTGEDRTENEDISVVDTRTNLYYTAVFNENLKFVNRFEFNATWGSGEASCRGDSERGYGEFGADGANIEIKNSYVEFSMKPVNAKVGVQDVYLGRGFLMDEDVSGVMLAYENDTLAIPVFWLKAFENGAGKDAGDRDVDYYGIDPQFSIGDMTINPFFMYIYSKDASAFDNYYSDPYSLEGSTVKELNTWYAGLNFDAEFDPVTFWLTAMYQGGKADFSDRESGDFKAWLAATGGAVNTGFGDVHGQFFYASGDSDGNDNDFDGFWVPAGQSCYWSEIMGLGIFDEQSSSNSPGDQVSNIMAANLGMTFIPADRLSITLDVWYAALAEGVKTVNGKNEKYLGTEVNLLVTCELVEGLTLDIMGAYLFAGDATTLDDPDKADPYEVGSQLSLAF